MAMEKERPPGNMAAEQGAQEKPQKSTFVSDVILIHEERLDSIEKQAQGWGRKIFWMIFGCVVGGDAIIRLLIWLIGWRF